MARKPDVAREPGAVVARQRRKVAAGDQDPAATVGTPLPGMPEPGGASQPGAPQPGASRSEAPRSAVASRNTASQNPESEGMALCLRLLTAAPRTRAQLEQALRRHGVPPQAAEEVLGRLAKARLVDDPTFARMWVESRHHGRGLARRALSVELRQRGVSEGDVREAVAELSPEQEEEAARRLVAGRLAATRGRPLPSRMRRLMGLLARKGYSPGLAYRIVREALEQEKADAAAAGLDDSTGLDEEAMLDAVLTLDDDAPDSEAGLDGYSADGGDGGDGFRTGGVVEV